MNNARLKPPSQNHCSAMPRICFLLAAALPWASAFEYEIVGVKVLNPFADRLSDDEVQAYNEFMTQNELRQRSLRSNVYNCCEVCYNWKSPSCGIYLTNGYCSTDRTAKCRDEEKADAEFDPFGYRSLNEKATTAVTEINTGLGCELAKRDAMEALVKALRGKTASTEAALESILEGVVLTCYAVRTKKELISSFSLWDATTDALVSDNIGDTIQLCRGFRFNVEAVVSNREEVKNVKFELRGSSGPIYDRVERQWRYMLYGDDQNEVIFGDSLMEPGTYMLRATPNGDSMLSRNLYIQVDSCDQKDD